VLLSRLDNPDEYAWRLFFYLNHQARLGSAGRADPTKKFGELDPEAPVVWETWALASGDAQSEVFRPRGEQPVEWEKLDRPKKKRRLILSINVERQMMIRELDKKLRRQSIESVFKERKSHRSQLLSGNAEEQEVRMNRAALISVAKEGMYSADGLEDLLQTARRTNDRFLIKVGAASKEVKADWQPLHDESQKKRYLWREGPTGPDGKTQVYGLVALHIITKDLPNWFWADFGHIDCESSPGKYACDRFASETHPVDRTTRGPTAIHGSHGVRKETEGTVWANYILRGTQTSFIEPNGDPTILSNPAIENGFQKSSCILCHA
jgi:hypothetical protein